MVRFDSVDEKIWQNHVQGANVSAIVEVVVRRDFAVSFQSQHVSIRVANAHAAVARKTMKTMEKLRG